MNAVEALTGNTIAELKVFVMMSKMILFHFPQILGKLGVMQSDNKVLTLVRVSRWV